jgi:hypothetical protein
MHQITLTFSEEEWAQIEQDFNSWKEQEQKFNMPTHYETIEDFVKMYVLEMVN